MLENLTDRLQGVIKNLRGQARLSEENISDAMREVRMALLEADVSSAQKVNAAFDFFIINADASGSDAVTLAVGTGWSIVGAAAVAAATSAHFRARKTGTGTWVAYRIS